MHKIYFTWPCSEDIIWEKERLLNKKKKNFVNDWVKLWSVAFSSGRGADFFFSFTTSWTGWQQQDASYRREGRHLTRITALWRAALCRSIERLTKASQTKRKPASAVFSSSLNGQTSTSLFLFQWAENESDGSLPRWICENSDLKISTSWGRENTFSGSDNWPLYHLFTGVLV